MELYIHIPFCVKKCNYCDFYSHADSLEQQKRYVDALRKEIRAWGAVTTDRIDTIFFGGGTPTCIPPNLIRDILNEIRMCFYIEETAEISLECNPGTVTEESLKEYFSMGINRLSIGMQSAHDDELKNLGRIHTFAGFLQTFQAARRSGFTNINVDVMTGLPGQTWRKLKSTLEMTMALHPEHISCYSLIVEPGTVFYDRYEEDVRRREEGEKTKFLPDSDQEFLLYDNARAYLNQRGYGQYEISNYAKEGFRCRHNIGYWKRRPYIGIGVAAASLIFDPANLRPYANLRFTNISDTNRYIEIAESFDSSIPKIENGISFFAQKDTVEHLSPEDCMEEFMFLGLRMNEGVKTAEFYHAFSRTMSNVYGDVIDRYVKKELMVSTREGYALTKQGMDLSNEVLADFLL